MDNNKKTNEYLDRAMKILAEHQIATIVGLIMAILLVCILIVLNIDNDKPINVDIPIQNALDTPQVIIPEDVDKIDKIVNGVNESEIVVISNRNNEQADLILSTLGLDIKQLISYAASIDPRQAGVHTILIIKPKEEYYNSAFSLISTYVGNKKSYFLTNGLEDSEEYAIAKSTMMYEINDYIILVMENDSKEILIKILNELDSEHLNKIAEENNLEIVSDEAEEIENEENSNEKEKENGDTNNEITEDTVE